jgi:hypothetical protein
MMAPYLLLIALLFARPEPGHAPETGDQIDDWIPPRCAGDRIDWVIAGGESGPNARPCDLDWLRKIQVGCAIEKVPFFMKQLGSTKKVDGSWGGNKLDGKIYQEVPDGLRR